MQFETIIANIWISINTINNLNNYIFYDYKIKHCIQIIHEPLIWETTCHNILKIEIMCVKCVIYGWIHYVWKCIKKTFNFKIVGPNNNQQN